MKKNKEYSQTIFKKLVFFTVVTSILPITFLCAILFEKINDMAEREVMESYSQLSNQYINNIEEKLEQYEKSINFISKNTTIISALENETEGIYKRGNRISEEVFKSLLFENQREMRNCMIYSMKEDAPVYGISTSMMYVARTEAWFEFYEEQVGEWFYYSVFDEQKGTVASFVQNIQKTIVNELGQEVIGIVKLDVYMDKIFSPGKIDDSNYEVIVYDKNINLLYASNENAYEDMILLMEQEKDTLKNNTNTISKISNQLIYSGEIEPFDLQVLLVFGKSEMTARRNETTSMLLPIILIVMATVTIAAYWFAIMFSKRINILVDKFKMAETGNLGSVEPIPGNDEISVLDRQFNHMLKKLDQLIQDNYVKELEKKETELKNLQLQINPHFLYNTLETISSISAVQNVFVVCDICQKLGEMFRYSLGKNYGEFVAVEQEIHHVQNYIFIQKLRYGNKFDVFYNIEPGTEQCQILRFILQPIVENAILHGLGPMTGSGTLEITVEKKRSTLEIRIEDDGVGMDVSKKEELLRFINSPRNEVDEKKSIGVRNVNQRIQLVFGEAYGIHIESNAYAGSSFIVTFPLQTRGENDV